MQTKPKKLKSRFLNSWITSLISITLVLILMGMLSFILINSKRLSDYVREKIGLTLVLEDNLKDTEIIRLQKVLSATNFVKSIEFIDKEAAAKTLTANLGEDFQGFLGYNPLFDSFDLKLLAAYTQSDSLQLLEKKLLEYPQLTEVYYQENLVVLINNNVRKISIALLVISGILTFIFFGLINNTIRLLIYSQRFTINTMQMVGASKGFIRKPFLLKSLLLGAYGGILANAALIGGIYTYKTQLQGLINFADLQTILLIVLIVFALGFFISLVSTWFALGKFLRMKFDELFY
ncbi:permease-like cell division protein FtsX [Draconibacterium sp. IB214405]|uniref:cell division protein FtsX n=1 Tax=Draconibacterium sp. IB214405 TaxID=3097352 RepID=UPI002A181528|nr:permease-like cell division protein FtsX [Draconibacterium sp. IB214405]MDX8341441.1 permease-like cell division protein FtsX [Draconibacterium sp. IB214405]